MAKSSKPRKKHNTKKTVLVGNNAMSGLLFASLAANNDEIPSDTIEQMMLKLKTFVQSLKQGKGSEKLYHETLHEHYLYVYLIEVLNDAKINAEPDVEMMMKLQLQIKFDIAVGKTIDTITSIGERYKQMGKWIAKGEELKVIEDSIQSIRETLQLATWQHCMKALRRTERFINEYCCRPKPKEK